MMSILRVGVASTIGAALTVPISTAAYAGPGDVVKTKHNMGTPGGNPAWVVCHVPHDAKGS